jgi:hypothetical protein
LESIDLPDLKPFCDFMIWVAKNKQWERFSGDTSTKQCKPRPSRTVDEINNTYGNMVVIGRVDATDGNRAGLWSLKCSRGHISTRSGLDLRYKASHNIGIRCAQCPKAHSLAARADELPHNDKSKKSTMGLD